MSARVGKEDERWVRVECDVCLGSGTDFTDPEQPDQCATCGGIGSYPVPAVSDPKAE